MAVVKEMYIGNTHIIIRDDYIAPIEKQQKILKRCGEIVARQYSAKTQLPTDKTA